MTIERRNPLPVGRYWVDVIGDDAIRKFDGWLVQHSFTVHVEKTQHDDGSILMGRPPSNWVLFSVESPTKWEGPGLPTVASPDVRSKDDTVQKPPPEPDPLSSFSDFFSGGAGPLIALGLLWWLSQKR